MIDKEVIRKSIEDSIEKCSKPHITSLPHDLRTVDGEKLQKRYTALNKRINKLESQMFSVQGKHFIDKKDMRYKSISKGYKELDKEVFEKSKPIIKQVTTLSKRLDKLISKAEIEPVSEKEERWATGLERPRVLHGEEKYIRNAREKLVRQTNYKAVLNSIESLKKDLDEFTEKEIKNQNGNLIASNLSLKLRGISSNLYMIEERNDSSTTLIGHDIPVEPVIELPKNFDKVLTKLRDYNDDLRYNNEKIRTNAHKEYWDAKDKLVDYYREKNRIERRARKNNIVLTKEG